MEVQIDSPHIRNYLQKAQPYKGWSNFVTSKLLSNCAITYTRRPPLVKLNWQVSEVFFVYKVLFCSKKFCYHWLVQIFPRQTTIFAKETCSQFEKQCFNQGMGAKEPRLFFLCYFLCLCYDRETFGHVMLIYVTSVSEFQGS